MPFAAPSFARVGALVIAIVIVGYGPGQSAAASDMVPWRSGAALSEDKRPAEIVETVQALAVGGLNEHLVLRFARPLTGTDRASLAAAGLDVQGFLTKNVFLARVRTDDLDIEKLADGLIVGADAIQPTWKLHPILAEGQRPEWAIVANQESDDPVVGTYIVFHPDAPAVTRGSRLVRENGGVIRDALESINGLVVELPLSQIATLGAADEVQWIEPALPRMTDMNDSNSVITEANIVQASPYGLDGTGVTVLVYDGGSGRSSHVDFGGRHTTRDSSGLSDHSTHVACTIGGSGAASGGQYEGMAPGVLIESYGFEYDGSNIFLYSNPGDLESDYDAAINLHGADISNNSIGTNTCWNGFPCSITGDYGVTSALIDAIVAGSLGEPMRIVWANGNERSCGSCPSEHQNGYHSTAPPACAKNHITVGALNSNDDSQTDFTSWGPTDDGRIKPDIAAPGCQSNGDNTVTSCSSSSDTAYTGKCGTSMAAPTVTGLSSLLLQDFRNQYPGEPDFRNSTLKTLLAHNAVDLPPAGPDYKAGFGSVRIQETIDFMRAGNFLEVDVNQSETFSALVLVGAGDSELKVTIAWDDVPALPLVSTALVNDIDLVVIDPSGTQHFPWTLDPANPSTPAVQTAADHTNNIEQVFVASPTPGAWRVEVQGFNVPTGPQTVSLAGSPLLINCSTAGIVSLDRVKYACASTANIQVVDCDLNTDDAVVETVSVTVVSDTDAAGETILLTETAAETAAFAGTLQLSETEGPGVLQIAEGDNVTVTYVDADDGFGNLNVNVEANSIVDCEPPVISFVQVDDLEPRSATVTFGLNEFALASVRYGLACGALNETATAAGYRTSHAIPITGLQDATTYYFVVDAEDQAGNGGSNDNNGSCFSFSTPDIPNFFTEEFGGGVDLAGSSVTFTPNGSVDFYGACVEPITDLPTDPSGGTNISLSDDSFQSINITGGESVSFYGNTFTNFFVGSNGYITFGTGDDDYDETLAEHFALQRIAGLYDDLNPSTGGTVSWKQLSDRVVVTFENVPEYSTTDSNTFQFEMYFEGGTIRVSYSGMDAGDGIAGLSAGDGLSPDFFETDLSGAGNCGPSTPMPAFAPFDVTKNRYISFVPNNGNQAVALQLELVSGPGTPGVVGWIFGPDRDKLSAVVNEPFYYIWTEPVIHAYGCEVVPAATYAVRATIDGVEFSEPLMVDTTPAPAPKFWGDVVGPFDGTSWSPANGIANIDDAVAEIQGFQELPSMAHKTWLDLHPEIPNRLININDVLAAIIGFRGDPYPYSNPMDCP